MNTKINKIAEKCVGKFETEGESERNGRECRGIRINLPQMNCRAEGFVLRRAGNKLEIRFGN